MNLRPPSVTVNAMPSDVVNRLLCMYNMFVWYIQTDLRTFHPKLRVDVGRGPGEGLGPRLYVGLASAAPLPLTATQADKVGIEDSFDVELNPAQARFRGRHRRLS